MPSEQYTLMNLVCQWLNDNGYNYEYEDYVDFVLLYVQAPVSCRVSPARLILGRGSWATSLLDNTGEKRGIMILRDKVQIGGLGPPNNEIIEIQAWDPTLFDKLKGYLS